MQTRHALTAAEIRAAAPEGATDADLIGDWTPPEPAPRKRRSKDSEFHLQSSAVKQLRLLLPPEYIVVSWCAENGSQSDSVWSRMQGYLKGWVDTGVFGDGRFWPIE